jgi:hypothetical protein
MNMSGKGLDYTGLTQSTLSALSPNGGRVGVVVMETRLFAFFLTESETGSGQKNNIFV